jgi:hypothetical protein
MKFSDLSESDQLECKFEIIDILHFFMNYAISIGMTPQEMYNMYISKNIENRDNVFTFTVLDINDYIDAIKKYRLNLIAEGDKIARETRKQSEALSRAIAGKSAKSRSRSSPRSSSSSSSGSDSPKSVSASSLDAELAKIEAEMREEQGSKADA